MLSVLNLEDKIQQKIKNQIEILQKEKDLISKKISDFMIALAEGELTLQEFPSFRSLKKEIKNLNDCYEYLKKLNHKINSATQIIKTKSYLKQRNLAKVYYRIIIPQKDRNFMRYNEDIIIGKSQSSNDKVYKSTKNQDYWYYHAAVHGGSLVSSKIKIDDLCNSLAVLYSQYLKRNKTTFGASFCSNNIESTEKSGAFVFHKNKLIEDQLPLYVKVELMQQQKILRITLTHKKERKSRCSFYFEVTTYEDNQNKSRLHDVLNHLKVDIKKEEFEKINYLVPHMYDLKYCND